MKGSTTALIDDGVRLGFLLLHTIEPNCFCLNGAISDMEAISCNFLLWK